MLKGLPASGKSTFAYELVAQGYKRVNKDDMRAMLDFSHWSKENEKHIIKWRDHCVCYFLREGFNVVVDDTNLDPKHEIVLRQWADLCNAEFEVKFFEVPLGECIDRDSKRGDKSVGAEVINRMYEKYLYKKVSYNPDLPDCYISDIDSTLAIKGDRSPYEFSKVGLDSVNEPMANVWGVLNTQNKSQMFIFSGREDSCREETHNWLIDNNIAFEGLFMRKEGDKRSDSIIKRELYEAHIMGKYNVLGIFDDRQSVCRLWYSLGLPLFRVGNPDACF